jgi:hypothetical protein
VPSGAKAQTTSSPALAEHLLTEVTQTCWSVVGAPRHPLASTRIIEGGLRSHDSGGGTHPGAFEPLPVQLLTSDASINVATPIEVARTTGQPGRLEASLIGNQRVPNELPEGYHLHVAVLIGVALGRHLSTTLRYMHLSPAAPESAVRLLDGPAAGPFRGGIVEAVPATATKA